MLSLLLQKTSGDAEGRISVVPIDGTGMLVLTFAKHMLGGKIAQDAAKLSLINTSLDGEFGQGHARLFPFQMIGDLHRCSKVKTCRFQKLKVVSEKEGRWNEQSSERLTDNAFCQPQ
jgi:hypothetical protein